MAFVITILVINFSQPFVFSFEGGEYKSGLGRYLLFGSQIVMLFMLGLYAFWHRHENDGQRKKVPLYGGYGLLPRHGFDDDCSDFQ